MLASLPLLSLPPAAAQGCQDADLQLDYGESVVAMNLVLDARACGDPAELGPIYIEGSLERDATLRTSTVVFAATHCDPESICTFTLSVPHPGVEALVRYEGNVSWHSTGPGPAIIAGGAAVRMNCQLATPDTRVCVPLSRAELS